MQSSNLEEKEAIDDIENLFELLLALTFHKLKGFTLDYIILSIAKHPRTQLPARMPCLYVGLVFMILLKSRCFHLMAPTTLFCRLSDNIRFSKIGSLIMVIVEGRWNHQDFAESEKEMRLKTKMNIAIWWNWIFDEAGCLQLHHRA